jgi:hypothetical protein
VPAPASGQEPVDPALSAGPERVEDRERHRGAVVRDAAVREVRGLQQRLGPGGLAVLRRVPEAGEERPADRLEVLA